MTYKWRHIRGLTIYALSPFSKFTKIYSDSALIKVVLRSKTLVFFSSDFKTLFTKQCPREILGLNFEKKTVYLNFNFPIYWSAIITPERIQ